MLTNQDKFLAEHNKLSPQNLQADLTMLKKFRDEKPALFKDDSWLIEKLRRPFVVWLSSMQPQSAKPTDKKPSNPKIKNQPGFHSYPLEES